jgi:hypothetical protein
METDGRRKGNEWEKASAYLRLGLIMSLVVAKDGYRAAAVLAGCDE